MKYYESVLGLVGRTPLVRLNRLADDSMATVLVKMEQLNPGGSVKDRMAVNMVESAEEAGLLQPGGTLVESTSGNTGLGLAMIAAVKGYRCVFTMPDKMSAEKIDMLKAYGAEVIITRTDLPHDHPESYVEVAKRIARETPKGFYTDQYYNMSNPEAHYLSTGPEIWDDTDGRLDCLVGGIGTGGTISGAGKYLKEKAEEAGRTLRIVCPDPEGSIYRDLFYTGVEPAPSVYRVEGIGPRLHGRDAGLLGDRRSSEHLRPRLLPHRAATRPRGRDFLRGLDRDRGLRRSRSCAGARSGEAGSGHPVRFRRPLPQQVLQRRVDEGHGLPRSRAAPRHRARGARLQGRRRGVRGGRKRPSPTSPGACPISAYRRCRSSAPAPGT